MNATDRPIQLLTPVSQAIERTKQVLFRPFDLSRWLTIGFCAWLALLGEGGGGGGGGNFNWNIGNGNRGGDLRGELQQFWQNVQDNLSWIIPVAVVGLLVIAAIVAVILWLSSRGRFMFLQNVTTGRAEVVIPWHRFGHLGDSLFLFRIVLAVVGFCIMIPLIVAFAWSVLRMVLREEVTAGGAMMATAIFLLAAAAGVTLAVIEKFTKDFVVPIMRLRMAPCLASWREFLGLLGAYPVAFAVYILFHVALSIGVGLLLIAFIFVTCCLAGCILVIPYIGTVFILPIPVFLRAFSLFYLAQYGPNYDAFLAPEVPEPFPAPGPQPPLAPPSPGVT